MKTESNALLTHESIRDVRPPNPPWRELQVDASAGGYLSTYYSDEQSAVPVRAVLSRILDNKADPNLETGTYGLFSTCSKQMRRGVVNRRVGYIFFLTRFGGERVISGYYDLGWYASTHFSEGDFCLAARATHFVKRPIRFADVANKLGLRKSRLILRLSPVQVSELAKLLQKQPDATEYYIKEVHRLERINHHNTGCRYVNFKRANSFGWVDAAEVFIKGQNAQHSLASTNKSPTGHWRCRACNGVSKSMSLLKICPACGDFATLEPLDTL